MEVYKKAVILLLLVCGLALAAGCEQGRESGRGLYLPEGNIKKGEQAFIDLQCYRCHSVVGAGLPPVTFETTISYRLGGEVSRVKTYGELVTSIINPQHVVSKKYLDSMSELAKEGLVESPMTSFNDQMSVSQLIDLVTFLDSRYRLAVPHYIGSPYGMAAAP